MTAGQVHTGTLNQKKKMKTNYIQILAFDEYYFVFIFFVFKKSSLQFFVFKFSRLQHFSPSIFSSSNFGYFNRVAAHSTFHALKLPRLTASLRKSKGNHGGQDIPYRWGGPGELWNVAPERSMNIISSSIFFVFKFCRLQIFSSSNFSLQIFSSSNFVASIFPASIFSSSIFCGIG